MHLFLERPRRQDEEGANDDMTTSGELKLDFLYFFFLRNYFAKCYCSIEIF